jgi:hypothetical protein
MNAMRFDISTVKPASGFAAAALGRVNTRIASAS